MICSEFSTGLISINGDDADADAVVVVVKRCCEKREISQGFSLIIFLSGNSFFSELNVRFFLPGR